MSTLVVSPVAGLRDQAVWQAWVADGRTRERRGSATRVQLVMVASIAVLLATAVFARDLAPIEIIVRLAVASSAIVVLFQAFQTRHYAFAVAFGALALIYNPLVPVFAFAGDWQRVAVAASALPFIASLVSRGVTTGDRHV